MVRTIVDAQNIVPDQPHNAIVASSLTIDQAMAIEYLMRQLDLPVADKTGFRLAGGDGEWIRVFRLNQAAGTEDLTAVATAVRTLLDVQRVFPVMAAKH